MHVSQRQPQARFAICLLENAENQLLFLKRAANAKLGANQWGFPAGHIELDESPMNCARRELDEEIGSDHQLVLQQSHPPVRDLFYGGEYEVHLFHFLWRDGIIRLNDEHSDYRWIGKTEFSTLDTVLGVDEDIYYLNIWPAAYLDQQKLPPRDEHSDKIE